MMKKKLFLFVFPVLAVMLFFALSANATLIESGLPGGGPDSAGLAPGKTFDAAGKEVIITPAQYVRYLYLFVMGFVGIAGLVTLVIWGTVWTASGVVDKKAAAMEGIKNTLYGIGIALSAYILLYTINPDLTIIRTPTLIKADTTPIPPPAPAVRCNAGVTDAVECGWVKTTSAIGLTVADCSSWKMTARQDVAGKRCLPKPNTPDLICCYLLRGTGTTGAW